MAACQATAEAAADQGRAWAYDMVKDLNMWCSICQPYSCRCNADNQRRAKNGRFIKGKKSKPRDMTKREKAEFSRALDEHIKTCPICSGE